MYTFAESFEYSAISDECYKRMRYRDRLCLKQALHCSYILYNVHVCAYQNLRRVNKSCDLIELYRGIRVILQRTTVGWCIGWYSGGRDEWWRVAMADCNLAQAFFFCWATESEAYRCAASRRDRQIQLWVVYRVRGMWIEGTRAVLMSNGEK